MVKSHPLVSAFLNSSSNAKFMEVVRQHRDDPIARLIDTLFTAIPVPDKRAAAAELAAKTSLLDVDPNVCALVYFYWLFVAIGQNRDMEILAIQKRAADCINKNSPSVIRALVESMEAEAHDVFGDKASAERIRRRVCDNVDKRSPWYPTFVWWLCNTLCPQGRGREVEAELRWLETQSDKVPPSRLAISYLYDAAATGRTEEARPWLELFESDPTLKQFGPQIYNRWKQLFAIYAPDYKPAAPGPCSGADDVGELQAMMLSTQALLAGDLQLALQWAREGMRKDLGIINSIEVAAYALIRAELALRHTASARYLMNMRRKRGNALYMDDFFWTHIEWQSGNKELAAQHFSRLLKSVEKYGADGRLNLELRLAPDLNPTDVLQLGRLAERCKEKCDPRAVIPLAVSRKPKDGLAAVFVGESRAIVAIRESILRFAKLRVPVLITAETGCGKELVARALHDHDAKAKPFVSVNCGAISETLLESELFGHARGAFTGADRERTGLFEEAADGTLFLDEIGEITPRLQIALLRVLENNEIRPIGASRNRKIQCRMLFATNVNLEEAVRTGAFRKDLLFRLRRLEIQIPPLRERRADILPLAQHFLRLDHAGEVPVLSDAAARCLQEYAWPGNVRELRNEIERMRLLNSDKAVYDVQDLGESIRIASAKVASSTPTLREKEIAPRATAVPADGLAKQSNEVEVQAVLDAGRAMFRRMDRLRELFVRYKKLTRREVAQILKIGPNTATRDLKMLCNEGHILRVEPTPKPGTHYFILNESPRA